MPLNHAVFLVAIIYVCFLWRSWSCQQYTSTRNPRFPQRSART